MKKVLFLGAGPLQVPALKKLKKLGEHIIVCDYDTNAIGKSLASEFLPISTIDQNAVLKVAKEKRVDIVMTSTTDAPMRTVAYVSEKLGLPCGISYENAICATIKSAMRERLKERNVPIPTYYVCNNFNDFYSAVKSFKDRCIIKPSDSAASRGVVLIAPEMSDGELMQRYNDTKSYSKNGIVLVEEYMQGLEVSVECFIVDGNVHIITITDKEVTELPYFVEIGHSEPSELTEDVQQQIRAVATQAIKVIGIINGVSHTELKVTPTGVKVVEIAARLGGDYITSDLVPLSTGVDMVGNSVLQALGEQIDIKPKFNKGSAIKFIYGHSGILKDITVDKYVKDIAEIKDIKIYVNPGDKIYDLHSSNDRLGHIIVQADNAKEAKVMADYAVSGVKITVEDK